MAKRIRKAVKYSAGIASKATARLTRELKALVKAGIVDKNEAKRLLKAFIGELRSETKRVAKFAKQELKRGMKKATKKAKPIVKGAMRGAVSRWRKARKR